MGAVRTQVIGIGALLALTAGSSAGAVPADFKAKADAYLKSAYPADGPGAAVIVVDDGKVVYAAGQGLADVEKRTPITPDTVFRIGSITKQFSAAVILQLAQEGKLSLADPVSKYLPNYPKPGGEATIAQLLNHTVGIQSYTDIPGWMIEQNTDRAYTTEQLIGVFKDHPAPAQPGQKWDYNNSGYVLVGAVIEAVTGRPWHQEVNDRIAKPLGLKTLRYGVGEEQIAGMARGYTDGEKGPALAMKIHMSVPHAAGALVGSVRDIATWAEALHDKKVMSGDLYERMISPTQLPEGKTHPYGFGLGMEQVRGRKAIGHGGGIFGFGTDSTYLPEEDLFVAVFTNSDDPATRPGIATQHLAAMALGDPFPRFEKMKVEEAALEPLFGVYTFPEGERRFFGRGGKLYTRRNGASEMEVFPAGGDRFFYGAGSLSWFELRRDPAGAHVMAMYQNGDKEALLSRRSGPIPPEKEAAAVPRATLQLYVGSYKASLGTATVAFGEGEKLTIRLGNGSPAFLKATSENEFEVEGREARVVFQRASETVTGLVVHQGGQQIAAERVNDAS